MLSTQPFEVPAAQIEAALQQGRKRVSVAGAETEVVQLSAKSAQDAGLIEPILVGDGSMIRATSEKIGWDISGLEIVGTMNEKDTSTKAVELARNGDADILMKGSVHTDALMRAAVDKENGLRGDRRMSHIFQMSFPGSDRLLYITDAALNVAPNVDQRLDIMQNAVAALRGIGIETPKIAVLSALELASPSVPSSMDAAEIMERAATGAIEGAIVQGPLSLDLAISPAAASVKGMDSEVAGHADLLVVPNIETGNALFKSLVYFNSATAAGLVLGAKVPIILTSRADPPEARLTASALATMI